MEKIAVFGGEHEDKAVNETEEAVEEGLRFERSFSQIFFQFHVIGVREQALTEQDQSLLYATSKLFTSAGAILATFFTPAFKCAIRRGRSWFTKARDMDKQP